MRRWLVALGALALLSRPAQARAHEAREAPDTREAAEGASAALLATTQALFEQTCSQCHGAVEPDAGLDLALYGSLESLTARRDGWERILDKLRSGEMPPSGVPRKEDLIARAVQLIGAELERLDRSAAPDPGRVTLRRLNRAEYERTIFDLLGVDFHAGEVFPADDTGDGFDNIGDVLTVSPVLMEKYLAAAERIAERALGAGPLPRPFQVEHRIETETLRRVDRSTVAAEHHVEHDAEYELVVGLPGQRPEGTPPATLGVWVDGALVHQQKVATTASNLVFSKPYSEERVRLHLTEGEHTLRLGFINDAFAKALPEASVREARANKWIGSLVVVGPYAPRRPPPSRARLLVCEPSTGPACVDRILSRLARRAYRRPVTPAEVAALRRFVDLALADGRSPAQGIGLALQAVLVSPHFLFHVERSTSAPGSVQRLSDVELASRLSYFLWSSMPDDELLEVASQGRLGQPKVLDAQVRRLLGDPRASALADNFAGQWLELRNLDTLRPDPDRFPSWRPELRDAMKAETQLFFMALLREDRPLSELLDARYTFLNETLAEHYGIPGIEGPELRRVALDTSERGGLLGHASVLAVSSYPTRTSVVLRGKYVLQNLLGAPPPPPPPDVPALDEQAVDSSASLRQQMEAHRASPVCASCHARMDPLGFGLENYDALGRWRTEDGGAPVDASGVLPGGAAFSTPEALRRVLTSSLPDVTRCVTEKLLTYALGRGLEPYDKPTVRALAQKVAASGGGLGTLVREIVRSLPFGSRRAEGAPPSR